MLLQRISSKILAFRRSAAKPALPTAKRRDLIAAARSANDQGRCRRLELPAGGSHLGRFQQRMPLRERRCSFRCSGYQFRAAQKSGFARGRPVHRQPTRPGPISEAQEQRPRPSRPRQRRRVDAWLPALHLRRRYNPARQSTSAPRPWRPQRKFRPTSAPPAATLSAAMAGCLWRQHQAWS
jgi:hypothetical protein